MLKLLKRRAALALQLSFADWMLLAQAWWVLLAFYLALRQGSYERILSASIFTKKKKRNAHSPQELHQLVLWAAYLHPLRMTCLPRALTLHCFLQRRGFDSNVRIGAQKNATGLQAHAWVEVDGVAVGETVDAFATLS